MSDVALKDEIEEELPEGKQEDAPKEPEAKKTVTRDDWEKATESKAHSKGWRPFDEFVENGGDPENWRTADAFLTYRELTGEIVKQRQDFNQRVDGLHKLTQAQLAAQRDQLIAERDLAIEAGQKKEVHALDKRINELAQPVVQADSSIVEKWNRENPWILEHTPKAVFAKTVWADAMANSTSYEQALGKLESEIKKHYPPATTKAAATLPESEKGHGNKGFGNRKAALTMDSLTQNEREIYKALPGAWKNEAEFLQAVADDRKAAAKG
ncbi:MAG: hypothetical protein V4563_17595 [Pseudomonadota bacterium]